MADQFWDFGRLKKLSIDPQLTNYWLLKLFWTLRVLYVPFHSYLKIAKKKMFRCPKFVGDAKQTLEIRVERKRNLKLGELVEVSFIIYNLVS